MGDGTGISWTDATWNPVRGCSRVSEGCRHCYAELVAARFSDPGQAYEGLADRSRKGSKWTGVVRLIPEHLEDPIRWQKPRRIFVNSMSDLFHESLEDEQIDLVFAAMLLAPRHTFQVLTKRAARMRSYFDDPELYERVLEAADYFRRRRPQLNQIGIGNPAESPAHWIWLGVSVENQAAADERIPELLATPAAVRFLSCEPLLGPVDVSRYMWPTRWHWDAKYGTPEEARAAGAYAERKRQALVSAHATFVDWVIAGCESGAHARPCDVDWLRSLRDQCAAADVAFFLKQAVDVAVPNGRGGFHSAITFGEATKAKGRAGGASVLELPYLDGRQWSQFPEVRRG